MEETNKQEREWRLQFNGRDISECSVAAFEACHSFNVWKDHILKVVDHAEFTQMVAEGTIDPPQSYWTIEPGQHGLVCKTHYTQYAKDWENMRTCYQDFVTGWRACEKQRQLRGSSIIPIKKKKRTKENSSMQINIDLRDKDIELITFSVEKTSDRQDQPTRTRDLEHWKLSRWDMFCLDVVVPINWYDHHLTMYTDGQRLFDRRPASLAVARFFISPKLQDPAVAKFTRQPTSLNAEAHDLVEEAAKVWFASQPEHKQMISWGFSAMRSMRDVLVLAGKFDPDWWEVFDSNEQREKNV